MTLFARRVAHLATVQRDLFEDPLDVTSAVYTVTGALFFASSNDLFTQFSYIENPERVVVDLSDSHVWDASTVASLDAISTKYARLGKTVEIVGRAPGRRVGVVDDVELVGVVDVKGELRAGAPVGDLLGVLADLLPVDAEALEHAVHDR